jgi:hypothetical protein
VDEELVWTVATSMLAQLRADVKAILERLPTSPEEAV